MPLADPSQLIDEAMVRGFRAPERMTVDQWADRYRTVFRPSPREGPWDTNVVPYLREPMRAFNEPATRDVVVRAGTQSGKTELLLNILGWIVDCEPDDTIYVMDSTDTVRDFVKSRMTPMLRQNPRLSRHLSLDRFDTTLQRISLPEMNIWSVGSNSAGRLSNKPARFAIGDEIDKWPQVLGGRGGTEAAALELMKQRTDAFGWMSKRCEASTPTDEGIGIDKEYMGSDRAEYHVPCPLCGEYQALRFGNGKSQSSNGKSGGGSGGGGGGVMWDGGSGAGLSDSDLAALVDRVKSLAWYQCARCGGKIESAVKALILLAGMWVRPHLGQRVVNPAPRKLAKWLTAPGTGEALRKTGLSGLPGAVEAAGGPGGAAGVKLAPAVIERGVRGYALSHLYSPFKTFGDVAAEWVKRRGEPDRAFVNSVLGEPWRAAGQRTDENEIIMLATKPQAWVYPPEAVPAPMAANAPGIGIDGVDVGPLLLVGAIDVQADHAWWVVRGFGEQERSWLVAWGCAELPGGVVSDMAGAGGGAGTVEMIDEETGEVLVVGADNPQAAALEVDNWAAVEAVVRREFGREVAETVKLPPGFPPAMPVRYWAVDSGDRTLEVYRFCRRVSAATGFVVMPCKGSAQLGSEPHRVSVLGRDPLHPQRARAHAAAGVTGQELLLFNTLHWGDFVASRRMRQPPQAGAWFWPGKEGIKALRHQGIKGEKRIGRAVAFEEYARQVTAEHRVLDVHKTTRVATWRWVKRPGRDDNHFWDCERMACALADRYSVFSASFTAARAAAYWRWAPAAGAGANPGANPGAGAGAVPGGRGVVARGVRQRG